MLCECCSKTHYPSGNVLSKHRWRDRFTLLLDGFIISVDPNANADGKFIPLELIGNGRFLSTPESWTGVRLENISSLVILDSVVAIFDSARIGALYNDNIDFVRAMCGGYIAGYNEMAMAFQEIGGGDALTKVKYLMRFCREHGIPQLTHAQIALATGLTRPTVTKTIHNLIKIQPELFLPRGDAP
ncbi:MAG TPA: hypothetical protein DC001_07335 [Clostridiales bacterium]|jgi:hypothetical protein|nr:hypothetical protein [Clostridiales bacterium]HBR07973.1 hypothetical protein [Clostridiales bacterium]